MLNHLKSSQEWSEKSLGAKGFTLIELLVVIVILGVLAAVVVFSVQGITDTGEESACKAETNTVETAVEAYRARYGGYPAGAVNSGSPLVGTFLKNVPDGSYTVAANGNVSGPSC